MFNSCEYYYSNCKKNQREGVSKMTGEILESFSNEELEKYLNYKIGALNE